MKITQHLCLHLTESGAGAGTDGGVHGGFLAALVDMAGVSAAFTRCAVLTVPQISNETGD
jgi:acyl-coenzyme A thioesterase PaaI-like protein